MKQAAHLPAWKAFNQSIATDGSVGIWHETFAIAAGAYESIYVNMPSFGLGRASKLEPATGRRWRQLELFGLAPDPALSVMQMPGAWLGLLLGMMALLVPAIRAQASARDRWSS
jgi:hypothetical protein